MDNIREKLVELLEQNEIEFMTYITDKVIDAAIGDDPVDRFLSRAVFTADFLLSNGVTVQEWIPVTERLPKEGDIVLCYMEFGEQRMAQWDESENCWAGQLIDYHKDQVTHWMPRPSAPKGE